MKFKLTENEQRRTVKLLNFLMSNHGHDWVCRVLIGFLCCMKSSFAMWILLFKYHCHSIRKSSFIRFQHTTTFTSDLPVPAYLFIFFFLYLALSWLRLVAVTFCMASSTMYYFTKVMSELFLDAQFSDTKNTLKGSTTMHDFWRVSGERVRISTWADINSTNPLRAFSAVTFGMTTTTMYYYTKVMSDLFIDVYFNETRNNFRGASTMIDFFRVSYECVAIVVYVVVWR